MFLHMILKDYLDLQLFNWKFLKDNKEKYQQDKINLIQEIEVTDINSAIKDEQMTNAHHAAFDQDAAFDKLLNKEVR